MTESERAISQLAIGAFFFACRACEYLKVRNSEKLKIDMLSTKNTRVKTSQKSQSLQ